MTTAKIFQPFQKVWTPRTPDSNYDSLGPPPLPPITGPKLLTEGIGTGVTMPSGLFEMRRVPTAGTEGGGVGVKLQSGTYTLAS